MLLGAITVFFVIAVAILTVVNMVLFILAKLGLTSVVKYIKRIK